MGFSATPKFPGAIAGAPDLLNQINLLNGELVPVLFDPIGPGDVSLTLTTGSGAVLPTQNFEITIDEEIIFCSARSGDVCNSLTRGAEGTTPASHASGAKVNAFITALAHNQDAAEINAIETALGVDLANVLVVSPPPALPDGTTATTQPLGDSTGKVATDTFVFNAIAAGVPPSGTAGGDLNGTYPNPTVQQFNGAPVPRPATVIGVDILHHIVDASSALLANDTTGTAANLSGTPSLPNGTSATTQTPGDNSTKLATTAFVEAAIPSSLPPSGAASGDLSGTYPAPTVAKVNGASIPASKTIVGTDGSSHIVDASTATLANNTTGTAANLSGTPALPNGTTATTQSPGDASTKLATDAFVAAAIPTTLPPSGSAGGDLSGTYPNPTVAKVNGAAVPTSKTIVGTNSSGQIVDASSAALTNNTSGTAANLSGTPALPNGTTATTQSPGDNTTKLATTAFVEAALPTTLPPDGAAGGDLSGTYPNPGVAKVNGAAVPSSKTIVGTDASSHIVDASSATLANNTTGTAANLSGTPALPNGTTATTQSPGDNTTKLATTAFVEAALPTTLPPDGSAGGDLSGSYPNPTVSQVNGGAIPTSKIIVGTNSSGQIIDESSQNSSRVLAGPATGASGAVTFRLLKNIDQPQRRQTTYVATGTGTTASQTGDAIATVGTPSVSATAANSTHGPGVTLANTSTNTGQGEQGNANYRVGWNISGFFNLAPVRITDERIWLGFTDQTVATMGGSDTPTGNFAAFRFSTNAGDTSWQCCTMDGTTMNVISSGVAPVAGTEQTFAIIFNDSTPNVQFYINGSLVATSTSHLPTSGTMLKMTATTACFSSSTGSGIIAVQYLIFTDL